MIKPEDDVYGSKDTITVKDDLLLQKLNELFPDRRYEELKIKTRDEKRSTEDYGESHEG